MFTPSLFLRRVLLLDAIATAATGVLLLGGTNLLQPLLGLPARLMIAAGAFCLAWSLVVGFAFTRRELSRAFVLTIIAGNALWAIGSILLLVSGFIAPTPLGYAFVIAQALVVGVFSQLQYIGLKKHAALAA